jgi:tetratricopeptide (TPR) repeat protein
MKVIPILLVAGIVALGAGCSRESKVQKHLNRAARHSDAGAYALAEIEYQNVIQLEPDNPAALRGFATVWFSRGAPMRAVPFIARLHQLHPEDIETERLLLRLSRHAGKNAESRQHARAILAHSSGDSEALLGLMAAARSSEDIAELEKNLQYLDRTSGMYYLLASQVFGARGDTAAQRNALQKAIDSDPRLAEAHTARATFLRARNEPGARDDFARASALAGPRSPEQLRFTEYLANTGEVAEAVRVLRELTRSAPDYIPGWRALAETALSERKFDQAQEFLQSAFQIDAGNFECEITRSRILLAQGETKAAIDALQALGTRFPGASADKYQLALAQLQNQDEPSAIEALRHAVAQNPDHVEATLLLARLNIRAGNTEQAAVAMMQLLDARPGFSPAERLLIEAMNAMGRVDEVITHLAQQAARAPERADLQRLLGLLYRRQNKPDDARKCLQASLKLTPGFLPAVSELLDLELRQGNLQAADTVIANIPAAQRRTPPGLLLQARVLAARGQAEKAVEAAFDALAADPAYAPAFALMSAVILRQPDRDASERLIQQSIANRADDFRAQLAAGELYSALGKHEKARDAYEKCLSLKPNTTVALNNLAYLYSEQLQQPERGVTLARKARQLDPATPAIADTLGLALFRVRDYPAALEYLKESAAKQPSEPEVQYHLGLCHEAMGQSDLARAAFQRSVSSRDFPAKSDAQRRLATLKVTESTP